MKTRCLVAAVVLYLAGMVQLSTGLQLPNHFYKASVSRHANLLDSTRPRPNEEFTLSSPFPFLGDHHCDGPAYNLPEACNGVEGKLVFDKIWVNKNGILSFGDEWKDAFLNGFPRAVQPAIAPLWSMLSFGKWGGVYYGEHTRKSAIKRISQEVVASFPCFDTFKAVTVFTATWHKMPHNHECEEDDSIARCMCLVSYDEATCACKELSIKDYCACVGDDPPENCTCSTVIDENTDHCTCLQTANPEYCSCVHIDVYSEEYCHCLEDTGNSGVCYCVESGRGTQDYCQCLSDNDYDYNNCSGEYKRALPFDGTHEVNAKRSDEQGQLDGRQLDGNKRAPLDRPTRGRSSEPPRNTFQAVLITDGTMSFVMFNYGTIDLPRDYTASTKAIIGFDGGRMEYPNGPAFNHHYSWSPEMYKLTEESNTGIKGRWIYRVDGENIFQPSDC